MNSPINILILEDNTSDLDLLMRELSRSDFEFKSTITQSRAEFESALETFLPDIILADFCLPSFDGLTAFRITRARQVDVPFILVSGSIGEEKAVELIKSGVTDYVLKDRLLTLKQKMVRALSEYHAQRAKKEADEKIRMQNAKLLEIAQFQSHIVRAPICQIQGLYELIDFADFSHPNNLTILQYLKKIADSVDEMIHKIVKMTDDVEAIVVS